MTAVTQDVDAYIREVVRPAIYPRRSVLEVAAHHLRSEPIPAAAAMAGPFEPFAAGDRWGARWDTTWFRMRATIPAEWAGAEVVALVHLGGDYMVGFSAEGLIWDPAGHPVHGLHHRHREYIVKSRAEGGEAVEFYVEAAANPIPPWHLKDWPDFGPDFDGEPMYVLEQADLATVDRAVEALYFDLRLVTQIAQFVPDRADVANRALDAAVTAVDPRDVTGTAAAGRAALRPALEPPTEVAHRITAVGHAHIDSAWLWPIRETKRKCARTFSNQLRLMERYPEHRFVCSQAVQYQWVKDLYPEIYEQIRTRVSEGRWEPVGGMWVESDANVPSGESLVRQLVFGKRFFIDEFGVETSELWIPDVFGYSAALPQIARQAGVTSLVTQKMSWNDTNVFPHSTFWWEGHDGSRVLAHFPPANTYNGEFSVAELVNSQRNFKEHGRSERSLYPFGYGDGGGGPTAAMLEYARRLADVPGLPAVEIGSAGGFLDALQAAEPELAIWVGELYLEYHRGTLTTHADVKLANRRGEEALRAAEMWSVAAGLDRRRELDEAWKLLLLQQFHDIIPGSSIEWVYEDSARDHAAVLAAARRVGDEAQAAVAPADGQSWVVFNPSSYERTEVAETPDGRLAYVHAPACGWGPVAGSAHDPVEPVRVSDGRLSNGRLRVAWDQQGLLTSVFDLVADREVLAAGQRANVFQLHEDNPKAFDAWEVDRSYLDSVVDLVDIESIEELENGPLRGAVRFTRRFGGSRLEQTMRLSAGSGRLEFHTAVDWREHHRFLKVAFPVAVRSARATYEIQHGHLERPTITNTSWDEARFEVCGQRWADLSEPGYGVALLNDCKYGYDIRGNVMRLSLLRAPGYPDPAADQGHHRFAYALLPHRGDLMQGRVVEEAESFNLPLQVRAGTGAGQVVRVGRPGISVEAVKWADRGEGVVVRLCEVWGMRGPVPIETGFAFASVARTDLLEREQEQVDHDGTSLVLDVRPFELVTLRFAPA